MDSAGNVGSVDHRVEARATPVGALRASGPLLVRVPARREGEPRLALDGIRQDERLAMQVDLQGGIERLGTAEVVFEIAETVDGPALVTADAQMGQDGGVRRVAQGVADVRVLPPGDYVARAKVKSATRSLAKCDGRSSCSRRHGSLRTRPASQRRWWDGWRLRASRRAP